MQIWKAVEFQTEVVLTSNGKMVFMYLGIGVKVAFPLKQGFPTSLRRNYMDRILNLSCGAYRSVEVVLLKLLTR